MIVRTRSVTRTSWHRLCRALEDTQHQRRGLFSFVYRMYRPWRAIHRRPAVRVCAAGHAITSPHRSHGKWRTRNHSYAACARERVRALHALPQTLNSRESHSSIETRREQEGILEITQFSPRPATGLARGHGSLDSSLGAHCAPLSCPLLSPGKDILSLPPWRPFVPSVGERPVSGASTCVWNSGSWGPATRVLLTRSPKDGAPGDPE